MFNRWRRERRLGKVRPGNGAALPPYRWYHLFSRSVFFIDLDERDGAHTYAVDARYFQDEISEQDGDDSSDGTADGDEGKPLRAVLDDLLGDGSGGGGAAGGGGRGFRALLDGWLGDGAGGPARSAQGDAERVPAAAGRGSAAGGTGEHDAPSARKPGKAPAVLYRDGVQLYRSTLPATFPVPGGVIEVAASGYGASRMHFVSERGGEQVLAPHSRTAEGLRARFDRRFPAASRGIGVLAIIILLIGLVTGIPQMIEIITQIDPIAERIGTFTSPIQLPFWLNTTLLIAGMLAATERALTLRNHWLIDFDTTWTAFS
ncbi:hypothetical protein [Microbacterium sp. gxy059]|uniref:hypothetical protein n=1 Tax=Microbacterium sp. gxy059 TaxID=2957199 RepID=UPI003D973AC8